MAIWSTYFRPFGIFYGHLVYFTAIWYILRPFGIFYGHLVYFMVICYNFVLFSYVAPRKMWQPCFEHVDTNHLYKVGTYVCRRRNWIEEAGNALGTAGLPDCSWYNIPKREKYTKLHQSIPNGHKIYQMAVKYTKWP
jgi:hypothetical protein